MVFTEENMAKTATKKKVGKLKLKGAPRTGSKDEPGLKVAKHTKVF
jgi:hypothetical protein